MNSTIISLLLALFTLFEASVAVNYYPNKFHSIYGCKQINAVNHYNHPVDYIPTHSFENTGAGENSTIFRIGIVGATDGIIRFSKIPKPYNNNIVHEFVVGSWVNSFTDFRRQKRANVATDTTEVLKKVRTPNVLSELRPLVLLVEFFQNGKVRLIRDGEIEPLLEVSDPKAKIYFNYIGFSNWNVKVAYFFDCPIDNSQNDVSGGINLF